MLGCDSPYVCKTAMKLVVMQDSILLGIEFPFSFFLPQLVKFL